LTEEAAARAEVGDLRGAANAAQDALQREPASAAPAQVAASILLITGDTAGALKAWDAALNTLPGDSLSLYGKSLALLARGDAAGAKSTLAEARSVGGGAECIALERYIEYLSGAAGAGAGSSLSSNVEAASLGLHAMAKLRQGDPTRGLADIQSALTLLPGDAFQEARGILLSFDKRTPIKFGYDRLPSGFDLSVRSGQAKKVRSGTIQVDAGGSVDGATYVAFRVDGKVNIIVNHAPYRMSLDTTTLANGKHTVEIVTYDRGGRESGRIAQEIITFNANAPSPPEPDKERIASIRSTLWSILRPLPSRLALAQAGFQAANATQRKDISARYRDLIGALDPSQPEAVNGRVNSAAAYTAVWRGPVSPPMIALTFDDGPKPGVTEHLLAALTKEGVPATFFVIGRHVTAYPQLSKMITDSGMQIENHSYTHPNLTILPPKEVERELLRTVASVRAATGRGMRFFRPPGGNMNPRVTKIAAQWGMAPCMWTVDADGHENGRPDRLVEFVLKKAKPGAIVLLHNGRMTTVEAIPAIVSGLRARGYRFVTVDQLLATSKSAESVTKTVLSTPK
jgi:peptidoglycan/xylan/chitin deacetylase (PgdA/CDA1 family)